MIWGTPMDMKTWCSNSLEAGLVSHFIQNHELSKWFSEISFLGYTVDGQTILHQLGTMKVIMKHRNIMGSTNWCRLSSIHSINLILGFLPGQMWGWLGRLKQEVKQPVTTQNNVEVSWNEGTPKSSVKEGFFITHHPFGGTPMTMETPMLPTMCLGLWGCLFVESHFPFCPDVFINFIFNAILRHITTI